MSAADYYKNLQNQLLNNQPTFQKSQNTVDSYNALKNYEKSKPAEYRSKYEGTINNLVNKYQNDKFSYDINNDPKYTIAKDQYTQDGKNAMENTMGNYAINTGGYNNSYAQAVGQKEYNNYMKALADKATSLQQQAFGNWNNQRAEQLEQISLLQGLDQTQYSKYRDTVNDYFSFLDYYNSKYQNDLNFDLQKFNQELSNWQNQLSNAQSSYQYEQNLAQSQNQFNQQQAYNYAQLAQNQRQFNEEMAYKNKQIGKK